MGIEKRKVGSSLNELRHANECMKIRRVCREIRRQNVLIEAHSGVLRRRLAQLKKDSDSSRYESCLVVKSDS